MLGFFIVVIILQMHTVVRCQLTPIAKPIEMSKPHIMERCNSHNNEIRDGTGINIAYPPKGTGLFRDPVEVLGPLFPTKKSINTCEVHISLIADTTSTIRFTRRGEKVCADVCSQYKANMIIVGCVAVTLIDGSCDYSRSSDTVDKINLATTCSCTYRIKCNNKSTVIRYSFQANCQGFIKVTIQNNYIMEPIT